MRLEMLRGTVYKGVSLEAGRVVDVEDDFGRWCVARGKARPFEEQQPEVQPLETESAAPIIRTRRGRGAVADR